MTYIEDSVYFGSFIGGGISHRSATSRAGLVAFACILAFALSGAGCVYTSIVDSEGEIEPQRLPESLEVLVLSRGQLCLDAYETFHRSGSSEELETVCRELTETDYYPHELLSVSRASKIDGGYAAGVQAGFEAAGNRVKILDSRTRWEEYQFGAKKNVLEVYVTSGRSDEHLSCDLSLVTVGLIPCWVDSYPDVRLVYFDERGRSAEYRPRSQVHVRSYNHLFFLIWGPVVTDGNSAATYTEQVWSAASVLPFN